MRKIQFKTKKIITLPKKTIAVLNATIYDEGKIVKSFTVNGETVCSDEDEYDEKTGVRIAIAKAKRKAFTIAYNDTDELIDMFNSIVRELEASRAKFADCRWDIDSFLMQHRPSVEL